ncbi:MAG: response regulator [Nitrospira sp.]|nr:response regulator [Nitrospira sp.]
MRDSSTPPAGSRRATILLVCDDEARAQTFRTILEQAGFSIISTTTSSEALKRCANHDETIDLLLTELVLTPPEFQLASPSNPFPYVNGIELAVRATALRRGLRVVVLCNDCERELAAHGVAPATLPVIEQSIAPDHFVLRLHEVLRQPPPFLHQAAYPQKRNTGETEWFG